MEFVVPENLKPNHPAKQDDTIKSRRQFVTQAASTALIIVGLFLIGWGVWTPISDYLTLQQFAPPPLPEEAIISESDDVIHDDGVIQDDGIIQDLAFTSDEPVLSLDDNPLPIFEASDTLPSLDDNPLPIAAAPELTATSTHVPSLADNPLPVINAITDTLSIGNTPTDTPTPPPTPTPTLTPTPTITPLPTAAPGISIAKLTSGGQPPTPVPIQADIPTATAIVATDIPADLAATPATNTPTATPIDPISVPDAEDTATPTSIPPTATANVVVSAAPTKSAPNRIVAPKINLDSAVVEVGWSKREINGNTVSVWDVAEFAAGWHKNSAVPGQDGNIVLSGHHNILGEVFRNTVDLEPGDMITLYTDGTPYEYQVEDKFIVKDKGEPAEVRRANARWIGPFSDQRLTMITCWPYNNNTHRVIVIAKPVENSSASTAGG